ncbi:hypothetical protein FRC10_009128 [Ceratobasidium sp. 414]|nr:hypothetical protein FRC10_009128 [Ceratobasidium sp. 414]
MPKAPRHLNMHRLFKTPELVSLICTCLDASYHPGHPFGEAACIPRSIDTRFQQIVLVSKQFYLGVIPYLWEHVNLLDLFKRGLIPASLVQEGDKTRVYISTSISQGSMTRFRFYAPYIKMLGAYGDELEVCNWGLLVSFSQATELLSNLVELNCSLYDLELFSTFLSLSTKRIKVFGTHCSTFSARLLEAVMRACPGIHSLDFHPELHGPADNLTARNKLLQGFTFLSSFQDLRALRSAPMILQSPVLELVAQLPCLKCLTVQPNHTGANWDPSLCQQLPPGSFPALDTLTLELGNSHDAKKFWELIPLPNLKGLDLSLRSVPSDDELSFIPTLCQASPQITSLQLDFPAWGEPHEIGTEVFEHLARLPLDQTFSLEGAILDFEDAWVKIATVWPHLKKVSCIDQSAGLDDLLFLSSNLPQLKYVKCDLDLEEATLTVTYGWRPDGQPPFYPGLMDLVIKRFELRELMLYNLGDVAGFIAYFWPKVKVRSAQEVLLFEDPDEDDTEMEREVLLNKQGMFRMFRELVWAYVCLFHDG